MLPSIDVRPFEHPLPPPFHVGHPRKVCCVSWTSCLFSRFSSTSHPVPRPAWRQSRQRQYPLQAARSIEQRQGCGQWGCRRQHLGQNCFGFRGQALGTISSASTCDTQHRCVIFRTFCLLLHWRGPTMLEPSIMSGFWTCSQHQTRSPPREIGVWFKGMRETWRCGRGKMRNSWTRAHQRRIQTGGLEKPPAQRMREWAWA